MTEYAIGIDVGGTKIAGGVVSLANGTVTQKRLISTAAYSGGQELLHATAELARDLLRAAAADGLDIQSIGLGVRELVDLEGNVMSDSLIGWRGLDVQGRLSKLAPAVVDSDVRLAALGEAEF